MRVPQSAQPRRPAGAPILQVSVVVLALGGVLGCLGGAARAAGPAPGTVPIKWTNGTWSTDPGAYLTSSGSAATGVNQVIMQQANAAVYNWQSFDIAQGSSVYFNMAQGSGARALNRVMGSTAPSRIFGALGSNGQVYLINQNGILFGSGAQVNVGGLVASALNMDNADFLAGLQSITQPTPSFFFDTTASNTGIGNANVTVEGGASIRAQSGRVFLFGGKVSNAGYIGAADGQVALAAGTDVYLALPSVANLRGLLIDVSKAGAALPAAGTMSVTNTGVIETPRGNTTLAGYFVNQMGRISATTSATANGSIYLQARDSVNPVQTNNSTHGFLAGTPLVKGAGRGGELILGPGSVTEVRVDGNGDTTDNSKTFYASSVDLSGRFIDMQSGASITATGGQVTATALETFDPVAANRTTGDTQNWSDVILNGSLPVAPGSAGVVTRVVIESGATIDVSGSQNVAVAMERNNVTTALLGANDFKDAPEQRDGVLYRQKITFDIRNPVPILGDTSAYQNAIPRSAAEKLSAGGSIKLLSSGDMALAQGSTLDVSGGSLAYQGGYINSTKVVAQGKVYDISSAPKDLKYDSIYGTYTVLSPKFGPQATQTWTIPTRGVYQAGYVEGTSGGSISLVSRSLSSNATIKAGATAGPYQRDAGTMPTGGSLTIGLASDSAVSDNLFSDLIASDIRIAKQAQTLAASFWANPGAAPSAAAGSEVVLAADTLNNSGLATLNLYSNGKLTQEAGADLTLPTGGSLTAIASSASLGGNITAHSGSVSVTTAATKTTRAIGDISVAGKIDTSGNWVNDNPLLHPGTRVTNPALVNGGTIALQGNGIDIKDTALLDVSGGAQLRADGKLVLGNGGRIALASAGSKIDASGNVSQAGTGLLNGSLRLDGQLRGAAPGKGGSLAMVMAPAVRIGGSAQAGEMGFDAGFFSRGGFTDYTLASINGLTVAAGTQLAPRAQNLVLNGNYSQAASGTSLASLTSLAQLPMTSQRSPVNLSLQAVGDTNGRLNLEAGAVISTDPGATVNLVAGRQLTVDGKISAPAGAINLSLKPAEKTIDSTALDRSIWLGSRSVLSAAGTFVPSLGGGGLTKGDVLAGGTISIDLSKVLAGAGIGSGMLVAKEGAVLDVRGASATLDIAQGRGTQSTLVGSKGGSVNIQTTDGGLFDATMLAAGGTPSAGGGQFNASISGGNLAKQDTNFLSHDPTLAQALVLSSGSSSLVPATAQPGVALDRNTYGGQLQLRADKINQAGFADVNLAGEGKVQVQDSVSLGAQRSITLNTANIDLASGAGFNLTAPYVSLGNVQASGTAGIAPPASSGGTGTLTVNADLIDLQGQVSLTGTGSTALNSSGDIRFRSVWSGNPTNGYWGAFNTSGDLTLTSAQAYATTGFAGLVDPDHPLNWSFNLNAPGAKISFASNGGPTGTPLSAGGSLLVTAKDIEQGGVLRAPLGRLSLVAADTLTLAPGSVTSVAGDGKVIPYGSTLNGKDWTYTLPGGKVLSTGDGTLKAPAKSVNLAGSQVTLAAGAKLDASGSGDLYGYEFVPGVGGSTDVLANSAAYAIVPSLGKTYAPDDGQYAVSSISANGAASSLKVGDTVTLGAGSGLPAGTYTLLPARYALLPGAYLVQAASGHQDMQLGQSVAQANGAAIVAGYRGTLNTSLQDSRSSGWLVQSSAQVRKQAEYRDSYGSSFFAGLAQATGQATPRAGTDAGTIAINAGQSLALDGDMLLGGAYLGLDGADKPLYGRGAALDIASSKIGVTDDAAGFAARYGSGYLLLDTAKLNRAGAESLMLGGTRSNTVPTATDVVVDSAGTALSGSDVILSASKNVTVAADTSILAKPLAAADALKVSGAGALLRVAGADGASTTRVGATPGGATLTVAAGAVLGAPSPGGTATVVLDSTDKNSVDASATIRASTASVSAGSIAAGAVPTAAPGLTLGSTLLGQLGQARDLTVKSYSSIDFYGNATLGSASLDKLTLDAYALTGRGAGASANINAGQVTLTNSSGANSLSTAPQALGSGTLNIVSGKQMLLGGGAKTLQGFASVGLTAGGEIRLQKDPSGNTATLAASGADTSAATALTLTAGRIGADTGADQAISTTGHLEIRNNPNPVELAAPSGLGARLTLSGQNVRQAGTIDLPAGTIRINATGPGSADNLDFAAGSVTRAAGSTTTFDGLNAYASAGRIELNAAGGSVRIGTAATIDISGADGGGNAGVLTATALNGTVRISSNAHLRGVAADGYRSGTASIEAKTLGRLDLTNIALNRGGFAEQRDFRAHTGDLQVGSADNAAVLARNVSLEADGENGVGGSIKIGGVVGGAFAKAGEVRVASATGVTLSGNGKLVASATGAGNAGGTVYVATASASDANLSLGGAGVDVSGGSGGSGGTLWVRAPQASDSAGNAMGAVAPITGPVAGAAHVILEGVKTYNYAGNVSITSDDSSTATSLALGTGSAPLAGTILGDAQSFMTNAKAIASRVGGSGVAADVRAGTEVDARGDINVTGTVVSVPGKNDQVTSLNFFAASASTDSPKTIGGVLTLRASGNLNISAGISDGFDGTTASSSLQVGDGAGQSRAPTWNYRLVGGADLGAADARRTIANGGDVRIGRTNADLTGADVIVRTATGNIEVEAGHDVQLLNSQAVVYTTGAGTSLNASTQAFTPISSAPTATSALGLSANPFTSGGGSIRIEAKNDVLGSPDNSQLVTNWLFRRQTTNSSNPQTAWWSRYDLFRENIATFGGGDITVRAGRDITDLGVSAATNARLPADPATGTQGSLVVQGGGDLMIQAGRNIAGGMYYEGRGKAVLEAGDSVAKGTARNLGSSVTGFYPLLALQDGSISVSGAGDVDISAIFNPTIAAVAGVNTTSATPVGAFSSYADTSTVSLNSLRGNIGINGAENGQIPNLVKLPTGVVAIKLGDAQKAGVAQNAGVGLLASTAANAYMMGPGTLNAAAFSGNITAAGTLLPAAQGNLNLLAAGDITSTVSLTDRPATGVNSLATITNPTGLKAYTTANEVGYGNTHLGDTTPARLVALNGDLTATGFIGKSTHLVAGRDVYDLRMVIENVNSSDQTLVSAGRDYIGDRSGKADTYFRVDGPGQVMVQAGRDINLGLSEGLVTRGNLKNPNLDAYGASLTVIAGVAGKPDYAAVSARYLASYGPYAAAYLRLGDAAIGRYLSEITAFVRKESGNAALDPLGALDSFLALPASSQSSLLATLDSKDGFKATLPTFRQFLADYAAGAGAVNSAALAQFQNLPANQQQPFLQRILYAELGRAAGAASAAPAAEKDAAYQRGYDAISTFLPGATYKGDLLLYSSQIKTQGGGDISIFVPGGLVNAGQVVPVPTPTPRGAGDLGITTVGGGNINAVVSGDFQVNQSRVFTLAGGGILLWSSQGSLDAGRGAKTASSAPAPVVRLDSQGNLIVDTSGTVSGSGIGTIITNKSIAPGDVTLVAPKGSINAGDAGIQSAGNLTAASPVFRGADNVQVGGATAGVPQQGAQSAPPPPPNVGDDSRKAVDQVNKGIEQNATGTRQPSTSNTFTGFGE